MTSLLDIAPPEIATESIDIRGTMLEVRAIRNREWAMLLRRFPELLKQMEASRAAAKQAVQLEVPGEEMSGLGLEMMPAVIAAGLGNIGDPKTEALIDERLTDAEQAEVFGAVMRLTMPPAPLAGSPAEAGQSTGGQAETPSPTASSN